MPSVREPLEGEDTPPGQLWLPAACPSVRSLPSSLWSVPRDAGPCALQASAQGTMAGDWGRGAGERAGCLPFPLPPQGAAAGQPHPWAALCTQLLCSPLPGSLTAPCSQPSRPRAGDRPFNPGRLHPLPVLSRDPAATFASSPFVKSSQTADCKPRHWLPAGTLSRSQRVKGGAQYLRTVENQFVSGTFQTVR